MDHSPLKIDLSNLIAMTHGDASFIKEILELIKQQSPPTLNLMYNSYEVGDFETLGAAAHKFKSSISYLGNQDLVSLTKQIERTAIENPDRTELFHLMNEFHAVYDQLMQIIAQELNKIKSEQAETPST